MLQRVYKMKDVLEWEGEAKVRHRFFSSWPSPNDFDTKSDTVVVGGGWGGRAALMRVSLKRTTSAVRSGGGRGGGALPFLKTTPVIFPHFIVFLILIRCAGVVRVTGVMNSLCCVLERIVQKDAAC